jgi:hypothetical protein
MSTEVAVATSLAAYIPSSCAHYVELDPENKTHGWITCPDGISPNAKAEGIGSYLLAQRRGKTVPRGVCLARGII